jgi:gliding motility-associated-like protein
MLLLFFSGSLFSQQDVGITTYISPISGCNVGSPTKSINVIVQNFTSIPVSPGNITVRYQVNGGPIISQVVTTFLLGNASFNFTFTTKQNLSACSQWNIKTWTSYAADVNHSNDTLSTLFKNDCNPIPATFSGPTLLCSGANNDSIQLIGGTFAYGLVWNSQIIPGGFTSTGVTTDKFYLSNLSSPTNYQVVYAGGLCPNVTSPTYSVALSAPLNLGTVSPDLNLCANNVVGNVSLSGFVNQINAWQKSTDGASWTSTGSNANPYSISSYTNTTFFRALVSSGACGTGFSDTIAVNIEPVIIPGTISGATNICEGVNSGTLTLSGNANQISMQWYSSTDNITFNPTGVFTSTYSYLNLTQTTYFKVVLSGTSCPNGETPVVTMTVDPTLNLGVNSANLTVCSNNITGNVSVSGFAANIVDWIYSTNGGTTWLSAGSNANPYDISGISVSTEFKAIIESGTCGFDSTNSITVTIEPAIIPGTILGVTNICEGVNSGSLTLSGNANETSYEWYSSADNITFSATGISTSTFNYSNLSVTTYFKVILQGNSCVSVETPVATLIVDPALNLGTTSPNQTFCSNNVVGNITITGFTSSILDWIYSIDGGISWTSSVQNTNPYDISSTAVTTDFRAIIESGSCGTDTSGNITITIEPEIVPGTIAGATNVCEGANSGILTLSGQANETSYEWYISTDNITFSPTAISTSTYSYSNLTATTYFKVILQGNTCPNAETPVIILTVDPVINVGTVSPDQNFCIDNVTGNISISGFVSTLVDWEQSINGGISWTSTASNSNPYSINGLIDSTLFRALIQSGVCGTAYSDTIAIGIEPTIIPGTISGATTVCASGNSGTLNLIGNANDFGFEWYSSTDNVTFLPTSITASNYNFTNLTQTTYFKVILSGNICSDAETPTVTVTVDPAINTGTPSADLVLCEDNVIGSISLTSIVGSIVNWEQSSNNGITWTSIGSNSNPYSVNGLAVSSWFRAIVGSGTCGTQFSDTISVEIEPLIVPGTIDGDTTVCSGTNSGILTLSGNLYDNGFQWYSSTDNITFIPTGITTSTFNFLNLTQTTYYKVVLPGNVCSDAQTPIATVTIDPAFNLGTTSSDLILCETNITGNVSLTGAVTLFDWEQSNDDGLSWITTGDNNPTRDISYLTATAWFRGLVSSGTCGSGYSDTIKVIIEPTIITGSISSDTTVCASSNTGVLTLTGNNYDFGTEWYLSTDNITYTATGNSGPTFTFNGLSQTTYFKVILQGNICSDAETNILIVTVDSALNTGTASSDLILCEDNITGVVSVIGALTFMDWEQSNDGGSTWLSTSTSTNTYDISSITSSALFRGLITSGVCGSTYSDTINVTIEPVIIPGTISSDTAVCASSNSGILSLTGNSNDFGYEWFTSIDNVTFIASGNTTSTYNFSGLTQTTYFKVILQGNICSADETNVITVTVDSAINTGTASSNLVLCEDDISGVISVTGALTFMDWEQSNDGGSTWLSTSTSTSTYDISSLTSSALFRGLITSGVCGSAYSDTINVTIEPVIIPGTISSDTAVCASSNSGILSLTGNSNDFGYEWFTSIDNVTFIASGNTTSTYNFSGLTQTTYFKVILQGNICSADETNVITVTVDSAINTGTASSNLVLCEDDISGVISVTGALTFMDWEQSNDGGSTWLSTSTSTSTYDISSLTSSALFRGLITSGVCGSAYSDTISVTIEPTIIPGTVSSDTTVCASFNSGVLSLTGNSNDFGYEWFTSIDNIVFIATGITTSTYNFSGLTQTTYFKVILQGNICSAAETNVIVVNVDSVLNTGTVSNDLVLCEDNISGVVGVSGAQYFMDWEQSNDGGTTWFSAGTSVSTYNISSLTSSALFRGFIASGVCGSSYTDTISVTIEQEIIVGPVSNDTSVCSGTNGGNLILAGHANDFGIEWYSSLDGVTFIGTGITSDTLTYTNLTQTTYYKVILQGNICTNEETSIITVTVDSILNLGVASADLTLCANNIVGSVQLSGAVSIVDWEQSTNGGATWTSTGDNSASHNISTISSTSWFRAFISSGACGSGYSDTIIVNIEQPIVPGTISGPSNICAGINSGTLTLTGNLNDLGYQWFVSNDNITFTPTGITASTYSFSNLSQTIYIKVILAGNVCGDDETTVHTITVDPPLNLGTPSADLLLCESNITGAVSITGAVTLQNWMQSNDGGATWFSTADNNTSHNISGITSSALFQAVISSGACGTGLSPTISVTIDPVGIPAVIGYDFTTCLNNGDTNTLQVISNNGAISTWQTSVNGTTWLPLGNSSSTLSIQNLLQTTQYQLTTNHGACPSVSSNIITGTIAAPPVANAGIDQTVNLGSSIQLNGSGGLFGVWTPPNYLSNPTAATPLCTPLLTTAYAYTVIDANGCTNTDYVVIKVDSTQTVIDKDGIIVYNILTLNGDGLNDFFVIKGLEIYENNTVKIFNGNGNLLYSQQDYQSDWNGTYNGVLLPDGVYLYTIEVSRVTKNRGFITIIRSE